MHLNVYEYLFSHPMLFLIKLHFPPGMMWYSFSPEHILPLAPFAIKMTFPAKGPMFSVAVFGTRAAEGSFIGTLTHAKPGHLLVTLHYAKVNVYFWCKLHGGSYTEPQVAVESSESIYNSHYHPTIIPIIPNKGWTPYRGGLCDLGLFQCQKQNVT